MRERGEAARPSKVPFHTKPILVSIITVVFRAVHELPSLLDSVARVKDERTEFIVIDGGSDDGTPEMLQRYGSLIDYWVSEPDNGIYDAMNKGIAAARGKFILHLNAGDALVQLPLHVLEQLPDEVDIAAFRVLVDGKEFRPARGFGLRLNNTLHHQGTFFRRERFPAYNVHYRVFADFDANQRLAKRGARIELFETIVATHAGGGASDTANKATVAEFFRIIAQNYGAAYLPAAWFLCKCRGAAKRLNRMRERV